MMDKFLLIGSLPSSGSTLFASQISKYSNIFIGPELGIFSHPVIWLDFYQYKTCANLSNLFSDFSCKDIEEWKSLGVCSFSTTTDEHLKEYSLRRGTLLSLLNSSKSAGEFVLKIRHCLGLKSEIWAEKTPQNIFSIGCMAINYPQSKAIIVRRNLIDTAISYLKRNNNLEWSKFYLQSSIEEYYHVISNVESNKLGIIDYESLTREPTRAVEKVLDNLFDKEIFDKSSYHEVASLDTPQLYRNKKTDKTSATSYWTLMPHEDVKTIRYSLLNIVSQYGAKFFIQTTVLCYSLNSTIRTNNKVLLSKNRQNDCYPAGSRTNVQVLHISFFCILVLASLFKKYNLIPKEDHLNSRRILSLAPKLIKISLIVLTIIFKYLYSAIAAVTRKQIHLFKVRTSLKTEEAKTKLTESITFFRRNAITRKLQTHNTNYSIKQSQYDLVICIATSGRSDLIKYQLEEVQYLNQNTFYRICVMVTCTSYGDVCLFSKLASEFDFLKVSVSPNRPLGLKWQNCVNHARKLLTFRQLMILGSDDFVNTNYLVNAIQQIDRSVSDYVVLFPRSWLIYDNKHSNLYQVSYKSEYIPLGAGRVYNKLFLDWINWEIFDVSLNSQLDNRAYLKFKATQSIAQENPRIQKYFYRLWLTSHQGYLISLKSIARHEMNPCSAILASKNIKSANLTEAEAKKIFSMIKSNSLRLKLLKNE